MLKTISLSVLRAISLLQGSVSAQEKRPKNLRLAYGALSSSRIPYWIAKDAKLDEKYGLDLNLVFINGAPVALNAHLKGQKVTNFIDDSLLKEIDKEGFFARLYK